MASENARLDKLVKDQHITKWVAIGDFGAKAIILANSNIRENIVRHEATLQELMGNSPFGIRLHKIVAGASGMKENQMGCILVFLPFPPFKSTL